MKHSPIVTFLKGLIVGGTMLVPGVSGGSMAIVLGIYDKLIHAVSALTRLDKASFIFLCAFSAGGGLGIIAFAKPLLHFMETYPIPTSYFFLGAVAGSVPITFRQGNISSLSAKAVLYILLGVVIVALFAAAPIDGLHAQTDGGLFFLRQIQHRLAAACVQQFFHVFHPADPAAAYYGDHCGGADFPQDIHGLFLLLVRFGQIHHIQAVAFAKTVVFRQSCRV